MAPGRADEDHRLELTEQGQQLADMVRSGVLDMSYLKDEVYPLDKINEAISG